METYIWIIAAAAMLLLVATPFLMPIYIDHLFKGSSGAKEKQPKGVGESPRPDVRATRQWVEEVVNNKTSNCVRVSPAIETSKEYKGSVVFRGKRHTISIDKTGFYGYAIAGGGRVEYEFRNCKITGEVWVNHRHVAETREAVHVSEVVADIQAVLNSIQHLEGELLLQIRTHCYRFVEQGDVEKGWPQPTVGNLRLFQYSGVKNFDME